MKKYLSMALLAGSLLLGGCGDSDNFVFTNTNNNVLAAPVCADDAYTTDQDTALTVNAANGVLANDTPNGGTVTFAATSAQAGTITGNADGSFTYTPPGSFAGDDSFTYTVANASGQSTCTVIITVEAVNGFFVDSVNGSDADGSFTGGIPFQTIQAAVAAAPTNADIVVLPGNYTGGINLKDGQRLLGSGSTLVKPQGTTRPELTGPVFLADDNTLDFLRIVGTDDDAVDGNGQNNGTVTNCEIANTTNLGAGVVGDGATGTWLVSNNSISNFAGIGVTFRSSSTGDLTARINGNRISNGELGAIGLVSENESKLTVQVHRNIFSGNNTVTGEEFEAEARGDSTLGLDLEDNTNDSGVYSLFVTTVGSGVLNVEQLNDLTTPKPAGAGNTGTVDLLGRPPNPIPNNTLFP